jgi:hypothetical protein
MSRHLNSRADHALTAYLAYADALDSERRASEIYADELRCAQPLAATSGGRRASGARVPSQSGFRAAISAGRGARDGGAA